MMNIQTRREITHRRLMEYYKAEQAILTGQSYQMGDVSLTRANLATVQKMIAQLENELISIERVLSNRQRSRVRVVIPMDNVNTYRCRRIMRG